MVLIATVIPIFLIVEGIRIVGAGNSGIIGFTGPVSTILLAYIFLNEKITGLQLLGTAVVLAGIFLITWKGRK
jgi:drug/metabolite transporter (DMT)-like permease